MRACYVCNDLVIDNNVTLTMPRDNAPCTRLVLNRIVLPCMLISERQCLDKVSGMRFKRLL